VTEIKKVGVVGMGTMGSGIAQMCIQAGVPTVAREVTEELAERGRSMIDKNLSRDVEKGRRTADEKDSTLANLQLTTSLDDLADCDLVIEAVIEDLELKRRLFADLDRICRADAILATNTSALSVTQIAAATTRPERVVGMHFFNPVPVLPLVEVVKAELSSDEAADAAFAFAERVGKQPIRCGDTPGFVVNRILIPILNDAVRVLDEGVATPEDIDQGMKLGANWPIGPLALVDLIGVDVAVHVAEAMYQAIREPRFAPPARMVRMKDAGLLGRKSGRGFYDYSK
jgi:3-hydroxybutyryl-CoA dehydrogenase